MVFRGIGLLIYGAIAVSTLDNFIRPKLISGKIKVHPVIILLGILGGLSVFGFIGIFIGPVILSLFIEMIKVYSDEYGI